MRSVCRLSLYLAVVSVMMLAVAPPADARHTIKLNVPRFVVQPHTDREVCTFVPVPMSEPFDLGGSLIVNIGGRGAFTTHHFLMWVYEGTDMGKFPAQGQLVDSKACLDFGPTDTNQRTLIGGAQQHRLKTRLPLGLAQQIKPNVSGAKPVVGIILNSHWINGDDKPRRASVRVTLTAAPKHTVRQLLSPLFDVVANAFINVPPTGERSESAEWRPGGFNFGGGLGGGVYPQGPACVTSLTSHMHKRGTLFVIEYLQGSTVVGPPKLSTPSYQDPPQVVLDPPLLVNVGDGLRYTCTHDNGVNGREVRMGCEEQAGVAPGVDLLTTFLSHHGTTGAAKRCTTAADCPPTDPAFPGHTFTGACVPANLVFGFTSEDDMCIMPGSWYPAINGGCDVSGQPLLN
jgi:hypothetical protein